MAKIGVDMDGTITALPAFFSFLCDSLLRAGHEVHVISYRFWFLEAATRAELAQLNVPYTSLHLNDTGLPAPQWKLCKAVELRLDMMFEDSMDNLAVMPPSVVRVHVGQALQSMKP